MKIDDWRRNFCTVKPINDPSDGGLTRELIMCLMNIDELFLPLAHCELSVQQGGDGQHTEANFVFHNIQINFYFISVLDTSILNVWHYCHNWWEVPCGGTWQGRGSAGWLKLFFQLHPRGKEKAKVGMKSRCVSLLIFAGLTHTHTHSAKEKHMERGGGRSTAQTGNTGEKSPWQPDLD